MSAESTLEHVRDQHRTLAESQRVMRPAGYLCISTPNRYSLGPDPQAGLWAAGFLPERWVAAYVGWQGGIPPKRQLLSVQSLSRVIQMAGFCQPRIMLPDVPVGQRNHFGKGTRVLIRVYHIAKRLPVSRHLLQWIGPLLHAIAQKPGIPTGHPLDAGDPILAWQKGSVEMGPIACDG